MGKSMLKRCAGNINEKRCKTSVSSIAERESNKVNTQKAMYPCKPMGQPMPAFKNKKLCI